MKYFLTLFFLVGLSPKAQAVEDTILLLAKCRSTDLGTFFISFGHQFTSGNQHLEHFATGIMYSPPGEWTLEYDFIKGEQQALAVGPIQVRDKFLTIEFTSPEETHRLSLIRSTKNIHGYQGNWQVTSPTGTINSAVDCTVPKPVYEL